MNLALLLLVPSFASAAEPALSVEVASDTALDAPAIAEGLGSELDVAVVLDGEAPARVSVRSQGPDTIAILYEGEDGTRRERVVELPRESAESTRIVVLLVANLARDQIGALGLAAPPAPEEAPPAAPEEAARPRREPRDRRFHVGGSAGGFAADVDGEVTPFLLWGVEAGVRVTPNLTFGVARISGSAGAATSDEGVGDVFFQLHGTPYAEVSGWAGTRLEPFGRVGTLIRGKAQNSSVAGWFDAAPYLGAGVRYYPTRAFSLGLEAGVNLVVTEELTLGGEPLPRWSLPGSLAASTTFHF